MLIQVYQGSRGRGFQQLHPKYKSHICSNILVSDVFFFFTLPSLFVSISLFNTIEFTSSPLQRNPDGVDQFCIISNQSGRCERSSRIKEQRCVCLCNVHLRTTHTHTHSALAVNQSGLLSQITYLLRFRKIKKKKNNRVNLRASEFLPVHANVPEA